MDSLPNNEFDGKTNSVDTDKTNTKKLANVEKDKKSEENKASEEQDSIVKMTNID